MLGNKASHCAQSWCLRVLLGFSRGLEPGCPCSLSRRALARALDPSRAGRFPEEQPQPQENFVPQLANKG